MATEETSQTTQKLFIQMSGAPGSGKSTVARLLGRSIWNTVVIDHDVLRSALLDSNMPFEEAAKHAYQLQWKLAQDLMEQSFNVIVDSTCNFQTILDQGSALAKHYGYSFWYVECKVGDIDVLDHRLGKRHAMKSQRTGVHNPPAAARSVNHTSEDYRAQFEKWMDPCRPVGNVIVVDSTGNSEMARDHILENIVG